jgi:hypothetical protein
MNSSILRTESMRKIGKLNKNKKKFLIDSLKFSINGKLSRKDLSKSTKNSKSWLENLNY